MGDLIPTQGYSLAMKFPVKSLVFFACLSLLAMQTSGLHLHIEADKSAANVHGTHLHQAEKQGHGHGHDHTTDIDVSLVEKVRSTWTQLIPLIFACAILLITQGWRRQWLWLPPFKLGKLRRHIHWRPPLRAPPTLH
jgi:hypothetical protein